MSIRETTATPPAFTRTLASVLPKPLRALACAGIHTIPAGYGDCAICGRDWTKGRKWLRFYGTRSPLRRSQPSETTMHVLLTSQTALHRVNSYRRSYRWLVAWRWQGDHRSLYLRPSISFHYRNLSLESRREAAEREMRKNESWDF